MKNIALIPLAAMLLVGCTKDVDEEEEEVVVDSDGDGFAAEDDCDDEDASINPDAEETVGDGIDSDCDGEDPNFAYVGDWELDSIVMLDGDQDALEFYEPGVGTLELSADLAVSLESIHDAKESSESPGVGLSLAGEAAPLSDEAAFSLDLSGQLYSLENDLTLPLTTEWDCDVDGDALSCTGETVGTAGEDSIVMPTTASFTRK